MGLTARTSNIVNRFFFGGGKAVSEIISLIVQSSAPKDCTLALSELLPTMDIHDLGKSLFLNHTLCKQIVKENGFKFGTVL